MSSQASFRGSPGISVTSGFSPTKCARHDWYSEVWGRELQEMLIRAADRNLANDDGDPATSCEFPEIHGPLHEAARRIRY